MIDFIKKYKIYIIILFVIIIYLLVVFLMLTKENSNKKNSPLFVTNNSMFIWSKRNNWTLNNDNNLFNWKDYDVYVDNSYLGSYKLQYNDRWYIFDEQRNSIKYDGNIMAFYNVDINVYNYNLLDIDNNEKEKIDNYIISQGINLVEYPLSHSKVEIDVNSDGKSEKFYIINSPINNNPYNIFSYVLYDNNNVISTVMSNIVKIDSNDSIRLYNIYGFIDIDNDKQKEIILSHMIFSQPNTNCEIIFKLKNEKYEKLAGC